jgi:hypothetical protein
MPLFNGNANVLATAVYPGDVIPLFNAETLTAPATSTVISLGGAAPFGIHQVSFQVQFASSPTASVAIFGSNIAPTSSGPTDGVAVGTAVTTQSAVVTTTAIFEFYWAVLASQSGGGALSVIAYVS